MFFMDHTVPEYLHYMDKKFQGNHTLHPSVEGNCCIDLTKKDNLATVCIWVKDKKDYSALAHECVHAANFTLDNRGVLPSFENDEVQAYLVGLLVTKALSK